MNQSAIADNRARNLSDVALGIVPPDTVIINATVFNSFTSEFLPGQSVWIKEGMIAYAGAENDPPRDGHTETIDADGMVLLPGLIDAHTHVLNRSGVQEFVRYVIPSGVTTVITESMELATIVGKDGIEYFVRAIRDQPIRFYYTISPTCGLIPSEESRALSVEDSITFLERPECVGLGEVYWGNLFLPTPQGERLRKVVAAARALGKRIEGHSAGARGRKLQAYANYGISSCHEATTEEEFIERLRLGYWTMIREGAVRKEFEAVADIFVKDLDVRRLVLTTDGLDPEEFITQGYLDASVRRALGHGAPPKKLYQTVTLNAAEHFQLDHVLGSISPEKYADIVFIPSPDTFSPKRIICGGKTIFANGTALVQARQETYPKSMFNTVRVDGYRIPALPQTGKIRAMESVTRLVTKETIVDLDDAAQADDVVMLLAMERRGNNKAFMGFLKGFGLQRGACGSTMCWDSIDMIVAGKDITSIETVINRLQDLGGGAVYAVDDGIVAEFPAPLCGVVSLAPMSQIREEIRHLEAALSQNGVPWEKPLLTLDTLGSAAIPHLRITHEGYVRLRDRKILSWKV